MRAMVIALLASGLLCSSAYARQEGNDCAEKIALAKKYVALTYLGQITQQTVVEEIRMAWTKADVCPDDACRSDFESAVQDAVKNAYPSYEQAVVQLMSTRLTKDQLEAAVSFSETPTGRAIAEMNKGMISDFAGIDNAFTQHISESVYRSFCSKQPEACARAIPKQDAKAAR